MNKKITVQFQANTRLKPKKIVWNEKLQNAYPLYVSVIYDGGNTDFKAEINGEMILVTKDLAQLKTPKIERALNKYERFIYNALESEIFNLKEDFKFTGFGNRIKLYTRSVQSLFVSKTMGEMFELMEDYIFKFDEKCLAMSVFTGFIEVYERLEQYNIFKWKFETDEENFVEFYEIDRKGISELSIAYRFIDYILEKSLE